MSQSAKDLEMQAELADRLQSDEFFLMVIENAEKIKGRPMTELERREMLSDLRNNVSVKTKPADNRN